MNWLTAGRIRWIVVVIAGLGLVTAAAISTWLVFWSPVFTAKHVAIDGAEQVSAEEVRAAADVPLGAAMVQLPLASISERVEALDAVASVHVEREWPNTVHIVVTERRPIAVTETAHGVGLIGSDGEIYTVVTRAPDGLPALVDVTGAREGDVISGSPSESASTPEAMAAFTVARSLPRQLRLQVASIDALSASAVRLTLTNGVVVNWGSPDATIRKADVLLVLLREQSRQSTRTVPGEPEMPQHYDVSVPDAPAWSN